MPNIDTSGASAARWTRYTARLIALIWAGCWLYVALSSVAGLGLNSGGVFVTICFCAFFLGSVAVAWHWEAVGGVILMVEGLLILSVYPIWMSGRLPVKFIIFAMLTMAVPALVAGFLFFISWWNSPKANRTQD